MGVCQAATPTLSISVTHNGNFLQGQTNAFFVIRVSNVGTGPTTAAVQVSDQIVTGLTITSLSGAGWTCSGVNCDRSDVLAAGKNYPAIVALASVTPTAPSSITYGATVYFGGDPAGSHSTTDTANVEPAGYPVAWGGNASGESLVPPGLTTVAALSGGGSDTLALKGDGTVVAWGDNTYGETSVPGALTNVLAISAGDMFSLALTSNGKVTAWGDNTYGETTVPASLTNVVGIAAGRYHALALTSAGTVVAWGVTSGVNYHGQTAVPAGLTNVVAVAAGWYHSVALKSNGSVVAWGYNADGESTPPTLTNAVAIAAGAYHTLAMGSDGTVVAWGANTYGQTTVPALTDVVAIAAGWDHSLALQADGTIVPWGYDGYSQLEVPSTLDNVTAIAAGGYHSLALNTMYLGLIPVTIRTSTTTPTTSLPNVSVDSTSYSGAGVLFNWYPGAWSGEVFVPGPNHSLSVLGVSPGATGVQFIFTGWSDGYGGASRLVAPSVPTTYTADFSTQYALTTAIGGSGSGTISLTPSGPYWYNAGTIANVTATPAGGSAFTGWTGACTGVGPCNVTMNSPESVTANFTPVSVSTPSLALTSSHSGHFLRSQADAVYLLRLSNAPTGDPTSVQITVTDTLPTGLTLVSMTGSGWTCTSNSCTRSDSLGSGQTFPAIILVVRVGASAAASLTNVAKLYLNGSGTASLTADDVTAIDVTGYPLDWGLDTSAQAAKPAGLTNVLSVAGGGAHSLALEANGTVVAWGDNSYGQTSVPGGLTNVVAIAAGLYHSMALQSDGTVAFWGDSSYYQNDLPAALVSPNCATQPCAVAIAAGDYHNLALMSDGTVLAWGYDADGEADVPSGLANAVGIAAGGTHSLAVGSDGSISAWGSNALGQIGVPDGLTGIVAVAAGENHSLALSSGGVVTAWGDNSYGQSAVPSGLTSVAAIAAGGNHSLALNTAGTIAAWGDNTYDETVVSSGLTSAVAIAGGANHSLAVNSGAAGGVAVTLTTAEPGTIITVDGNTLTAEVVVEWGSGTSHTLLAPSPQPISTGERYAFSSWSDAGAATHTVTPTAAITYTANFVVQYQLTTAVNIPGAGTTSPANGTWYKTGATATVTATPSADYHFTGWSGACTGTGPCTITMSSPQSVTADFTAYSASLSITSTHSGKFYRDENPADYTLTVKNSAKAGPTSGTVTVTEYAPPGMALNSLTGTGWSCAGSACTRSDVLAAGASYPPITVSVYVLADAPASANNGASVSGGNSPSATTSDHTLISRAEPE